MRCGKTSTASLTAPNGQAQQALLVRQWGRYQVRCMHLSEAHGTGTALGDPIEAGSPIQQFCLTSQSSPLQLAVSRQTLGTLRRQLA